MGKQLINKMISNLKKANLVTKVSPWMNEMGGEARYVGIKVKDWEEVISAENNLLLKFGIADKKDFVSVLLANKPPFVLLTHANLDKESTWEKILGPLKQRLNRDKKEYTAGKPQIDNLYQKIKKDLK